MYIDILEDSPFFRLERFIHVWEGQSEGENALANYLKEKRESLRYLWGWVNLPVFSTSPVRSRPRRTYDPTRDLMTPKERCADAVNGDKSDSKKGGKL